MDFSRHVSRRLHEEHMATLVLWGRVQQAFAAGKPDPALMKQAAVALAGEIGQHFDFEERALFPLLRAGGEGELADLLAEEHVPIREAGRQFISLQGKDAPGTGDAQDLRRLALELAERLAAHVHKEEQSLLPACENLLDEDADRELIGAYAMG